VAATDSRALLLREAEALFRTRGYAAFSYADLSERVGISKASIHHHFATKEALGAAFIDDYLERFTSELATIERRRAHAKGRLHLYARLFSGGLERGMLPLCGILSAGAMTLPESLKARTRRFFDMHLEWLERTVRDGIASGQLRPDLDPSKAALLIFSTVEGASFVAWALLDNRHVGRAFQQAMTVLANHGD
jgi:TetR/AcrR family transcriptional repressor of nem operon